MASDGKFTEGNKAAAGRGPNKINRKVKEAVVKILEDNIEKVQDDLDELDPKDRIKLIFELLQYSLPKLASVKTENDTNISGSITVEWKEPRI